MIMGQGYQGTRKERDRSGSLRRSTYTPSTASNVFNARVKLANTRISSKVEVMTSTRVIAVWKVMATAGIPCLFSRARKRSMWKSWPMTCNARGPAMTMALTVETSRVASIRPTRREPVSP